MRFKAVILVVSGSFLAVTGCAEKVWVKDGASQQDFKRDSYSCERDMRQSGYYGSGLLGAVAAMEFSNRCMEAAGYSMQQQPTQATTISPASTPLIKDPTLPKTDEECHRQFGTTECPGWVVRARSN